MAEATANDETTQPSTTPEPRGGLSADERATLLELFELVDVHLAPNSSPPSSISPEAWKARGCLSRLEGLKQRL